MSDQGVARRERTKTATRTLADLPGPRGLPFVGNLHQLEIRRFHLIVEGWARQYGPLSRFALAGQTVLVVADAEIGESLLRSRPSALRRTGNLERLFAEIGAEGVFSVEGAAWRSQRRLAMEALSLKSSRAFFPTLRGVAERLLRRWTKSAGTTLEITDDLMRFTVDVTTTLAFGTDMNTLEGGDDVLQRHLSHIFPALARRSIAPFAYWRWVRLPVDRELDRALAALRALQARLVGQARARLAALPEEERHASNFLEAMILARDADGAAFTDEVIYGNTLTMLIAGEDTTAITLGWILHLLCDHPEIVTRARAEIDEVLGADLTPRDFEQASRFPYLDAIATEAMRLRPVAPMIGLEANEDMVVGDVAVPRGTWLQVLTRVPAMDASNFVAPEAFRPERWLPDPAPGAHTPSANMPFGSGPRICPGRTLALLEMRVVLATLLRSFDIERVGAAADVTEVMGFVVAPRGLRVRLRPRAKTPGIGPG